MANNPLNSWKYSLLAAWEDTVDLRAILGMESTNADTANDGISFISQLTLDECGASGYERVALTGETVTRNDSNDRAELAVNTITFAGLGGNALRNYVGIVLYDHVSEVDSECPAVGYIHFTNGPLSKQATQIDVPVPSPPGLVNILR